MLDVLLCRKDPSAFFSFPVTDFIAPGYSSIIKRPMDFSTMKDKVKKECYHSLDELKVSGCTCLSWFRNNVGKICHPVRTMGQDIKLAIHFYSHVILVMLCLTWVVLLMQMDFKLMCENAMVYNKQETIYHKAARKLLHSGMKILSQVWNQKHFRKHNFK